MTNRQKHARSYYFRELIATWDMKHKGVFAPREATARPISVLMRYDAREAWRKATLMALAHRK